MKINIYLLALALGVVSWSTYAIAQPSYPLEISEPKNGSRLNPEKSFVIKGKSAVGSKIILIIHRDGRPGDKLFEELVDVEDGEWSKSIEPDECSNCAGLERIAISVQQHDNNEVHRLIHVIVDTDQPGTPSVSTPARGGYFNKASRVEDSDEWKFQISGTVPDDEEMSIKISVDLKHENSNSYKTHTSMTADGAWSLFLPLVEGRYTIRVKATDSAGNNSETTAPFAFEVDTVAPVVGIDRPGNAGGYINRSMLVDGRVVLKGAVEAGGLVDVYLGGQVLETGIAENNGSWKLSRYLSEGQYNVDVRATDKAGNVSEQPAMGTFELDTTLPMAKISTQGIKDYSNSSRVVVSYALMEKEDVRTVCLLDDKEWPVSLAGSDIVMEGIGDGRHVLSVSIYDMAGNELKEVFNWSISTKLPAVSLLEPKSGSATNSRRKKLTGAAGKPYSRMIVVLRNKEDSHKEVYRSEFSLDDADGLEWSATPDVDLEDGEYEVDVQATDLYGNTGYISPGAVFYVDTARPDTIIRSGPAAHESRDLAAFVFASNATDVVGFECWASHKNKDEWEPCTETTVYHGLQNGEHTLRVRAIDAAGNVDLDYREYVWIVDAVPSSGPAVVVYDPGSGAFSLGCSSSGLGSGPFELCWLVVAWLMTIWWRRACR